MPEGKGVIILCDHLEGGDVVILISKIHSKMCFSTTCSVNGAFTYGRLRCQGVVVVYV